MSPEAHLQVLLEDGSSSDHRIPARGLVIGTASTADVRLPPHAALGSHHLRLQPTEDGCRVDPIGNARVEVAGRTWGGGLLPWDSYVSVGPVRLRFTRPIAPEVEPEKRASPVIVLGLLGIAMALWVVLSDGGDPVSARPPVEPPTLFDVAAGCPAGDGPTRHRAEQDAHAATAKSERYPFAPADGVQAVLLFRGAARCHEAAGDAVAARQLEARARRLEERVEQDYRTSRFRLGRALEEGRLDDALAEVELLRELLAHRGGPYVEWLGDLQRRIESRQSREAR